ncbi:LysR family transcriptional regulator [Escherichia coli]
MHVSPSTLSRQIQRLEEDLGQPLFVRDNRTVTLTERAQELRVFAQQTLLQYQQLRHTIDQQAVALWRITYLLLGDCCLQPSAADSGSLPRGTPVGGDQTHHW